MVGAEVGRIYVCDASVSVGIHELVVEVDGGAQIAAPQPSNGGKFVCGECCVECMVEVNAVCLCGVESAWCVGEVVAAFVVEGA
jgi:hypothetical protein